MWYTWKGKWCQNWKINTRCLLLNHTRGENKLNTKCSCTSHSWCRARVRQSAWGIDWTKGGFCAILTSCSPESTSKRRMSIRPSRRSVYKSPMRQVTLPKWEFTHLVNVFFCTASRSSAKNKKREQLKLWYNNASGFKNISSWKYIFTGIQISNSAQFQTQTDNIKSGRNLSPCPKQFISQIS